MINKVPDQIKLNIFDSCVVSLEVATRWMSAFPKMYASLFIIDVDIFILL